jgi:hypothetical protein
MTNDNTVAEIKAACGTALGVELDRHPSVRLSDSGPSLRRPRRLLNRTHASDAVPETVAAVGEARVTGTESIDPRLKAISSE